MGDIADQAERFEQIQHANAIDKIVNRQQGTPLVNSKGQRLCRDCEEIIPFPRVLAAPHAVRCYDAAPYAVRCYDCQVIIELHK